MPDHRAVAVIDLALFTRSRHNHRVGLTGPLAAQRDDEATDARILGGEAVIIDEIAPDRHGIAAAGERHLDQLAIRFARAGRGRTPWGWWRRVQRGGEIPGKRAPGSVDTSLAGFAAGWPHRPGGRTVSPAALR
jgi:hypothetical protein